MHQGLEQQTTGRDSLVLIWWLTVVAAVNPVKCSCNENCWSSALERKTTWELLAHWRDSSARKSTCCFQIVWVPSVSVPDTVWVCLHGSVDPHGCQQLHGWSWIHFMLKGNNIWFATAGFLSYVTVVVSIFPPTVALSFVGDRPVIETPALASLWTSADSGQRRSISVGGLVWAFFFLPKRLECCDDCCLRYSKSRSSPSRCEGWRFLDRQALWQHASSMSVGALLVK